MHDPTKIRSVVARFFSVPETVVTDDFVFPRERLQGSVGRTTLHAALKRLAGADLPGAFTANTYGQLMGTAPPAANGEKGPGLPTLPTAAAASPPEGNNAPSSAAPPMSAGLGIDIESADNLPWTGDPWTEAFYVENFTGPEIAYCLRQADPRLSFCGLWCAKEAAIKCGPDFAGLRPIEIEIQHSGEGRPSLRKAGIPQSTQTGDCQVSISHAGRTCVAVCLLAPPVGAAARAPLPSLNGVVSPQRGSIVSWPVWLSLALSLLAVLLSLANWIRR